MEQPKKPLSRFALAGFGLAVIAALIGLAAGPGARLGLWHFRTGFGLLSLTGNLGLAAAFISLFGQIVTRPTGRVRGFGLAFAGLIIGLACTTLTWRLYQTAQRLPAIHDITTDTENPPQFVALLAVRGMGANSPVYGGPKIAEQQHRAYPDIKPVILDLPFALAFEKVEKTARKMGWKIIASVPPDGRLEATDTTFWFGFTDDIVIRVTPYGAGSRVDARSLSRVGRSDMGTNAKRLRAFFAALSESAD